MARQSLQKVYADFRQGWVDISNPLQQPEGTVKDIVNFDINIDGTLSKRSGLKRSGSLLSGTFTEEEMQEPFDVHLWDNVGRNIDRKFLLVRRSNDISIFDISHGNVDLSDDYLIYTGTFSRSQFSSVDEKKLDGVSALGKFFVAFNSYGVGYFEYNETSQTVSFKEINIRFRDLFLWEGSNDTETGFNKYTSTYTYPWYTYNLENSGWDRPTRVSKEANPDNGTFSNVVPWGYVKSRLGYWPQISIPFSACKAGAGGGINEIQAFSAWYTDVDYFGNSKPALGRNIFNLYQFTRTGDIANSPAFTTPYNVVGTHSETYTLTEAPSKIAFYAGRLWYTGDGTHTSTVNTARSKSPFDSEGTIYFSQTIGTSLENAGKCYQENDPTAEDINQLLATDGGSFTIKEAGSIKALVPLSTSLFILSDQGIWRVAGVDFNSFSPESYTIDKISDKGITSEEGWSLSQDTLYTFTEDGLFAIKSEGSIGEISYVDLSTPLIKNYFNSLSRKTIANAVIEFDKTRNILIALLAVPTSSASENFFRRNHNTALIYNADMNCFYKYELNGGVSPNNIMSAIYGPSVQQTSNEELVFDSTGETVVDSLGEDVVVPGESFFEDLGDRLTIIVGDVDEGWIYPATFSDNVDFVDLGRAYEAEVEIGFDSLGALISDNKQAPYIVAFLERDFDISEVEPELEPV